MIDRERKKVVESPSGSIVTTWEGSVLPEIVELYSGLVRLKVRPFIPAVIQCYRCYRYGHYKIHCTSSERCKVCGDVFHDRCDKEPRCLNCGQNHRQAIRGVKDIDIIMT